MSRHMVHRPSLDSPGRPGTRARADVQVDVRGFSCTSSPPGLSVRFPPNLGRAHWHAYRLVELSLHDTHDPGIAIIMHSIRLSPAGLDVFWISP